jgi:uncharacterized protein (TIGR03000 family)
MTHRWHPCALAASLVVLVLPAFTMAQKSQPHGLKPSSSTNSSSNPVAMPATPAGYQSSYLGPDSSGPAARIHIKVPENARIWFENIETKQNGTERDFVSPPLTPGVGYTYHVRAQWTDNGQNITQTREFRVRAGNSVSLDFLTSK